MVKQVAELVDDVEGDRWYSHFASVVGQSDAIAALQISIPLEPFLQTAVVQRTVEQSRR